MSRKGLWNCCYSSRGGISFKKIPDVVDSEQIAIAIPRDGCILTGYVIFMSQHPSLKGKGAIQAKRSVLKRFERVELLKKRGQFKEGQRVIGLPKTKPED